MLIVAVVLPPLLACWEDASITSAANPLPPRDGIHDTPQKANGSGVRVRYRADGLAVAGQPFAVTLYFDAVTDPAATLRLSSDASLQMSMPTSELPLSLDSSELTMTVTPSADGLAYLNVFTSQLGAGGVTSIPVQTGGGQPRLPARGELKSDTDGEPMITFKVP
ncbi:hypothetical protein BH10PSE18_BH10PSE18_09800 [soil metagenome]